MEKISGILSSSPRLTAVDLKDAAPVRPGTPSFGRPQGVSSLTENQVFNQTSMRANSIHNQQMDWRHRDAEKAEIARTVSERFFGKNRTQGDLVVDNDIKPFTQPSWSQEAVRSTPAGFKTDEVGSFGATSDRPSVLVAMDEEEEPMMEQPEGLFPKGSFLDKTV